jgi:hypothetical protein
MIKPSAALFFDDMPLHIRKEYGFLVSIGKENNEIEEMLQQYYSNILNCDDPEEDVFWFALAYCEWKKGRLSSYVKEKALSALDSGRELERWNEPGSETEYKKRKKVLSDLKEMLLSPMPPAKKAKKPTLNHCPWPVGSLLAYKIVSNKEHLSEHPCFNKYVLLRIVKIDRSPITKILPEEYYNESMIIGLYNWIGNEIPDQNIVEELEYIPFDELQLLKPTNPIDLSALVDTFPDELKDTATLALGNLLTPKTVTCMILVLSSIRETAGVITYLGCDDSFKDHIPDFFNTSIYSTPLVHLGTLDITLSKRMAGYLKEQ